ncbi:triose-phosphate isomerase [Jannaschia sp. Os4]|uniref:triose-phosphate isomerase n=1 Tax=Jannaschia sp. Os4 TaxID=2807617 RepID=UPI00193ADBF5|nr:triose-phosphate isomerase [Jannaschia sp. Os4]MBM2576870.1 triose-phosphate isomerase [Jannaschia sp. Os4]
MTRTTPRKLAAGNWKMNGSMAALDEARAVAAAVPDGIDALLCPPATLIGPMAAAVEGTALSVGGQACHAAASGAHTGDLSAEMLGEAGARYVLCGHSERRTDHEETDDMVRDHVAATWRAGLVAVLCIGETLAQRDAGHTLAVLGEQLVGSLPEGATPDNLVIAYEPVWAIGTGRVAEPAQVAEVHDDLRARLGDIFGDAGAGFALLYGGSVKASNAPDLFALANVDGALVGGASLKATDFVPIMEALAAS